MLQRAGRGHIAHIRKGHKIAEGGHPVRAARTHISRCKRGIQKPLNLIGKVDFSERFGKRHANRRARRAHMLERSGRRKAERRFQFPHKLPAVERVQQVDIARAAVEHGDRKLALFHEYARGLLVRVAAVFQFQFFHAVLLISGVC